MIREFVTVYAELYRCLVLPWWSPAGWLMSVKLLPGSPVWVACRQLRQLEVPR